MKWFASFNTLRGIVRLCYQVVEKRDCIKTQIRFTTSYKDDWTAICKREYCCTGVWGADPSRDLLYSPLFLNNWIFLLSLELNCYVNYWQAPDTTPFKFTVGYTSTRENRRIIEEKWNVIFASGHALRKDADVSILTTKLRLIQNVLTTVNTCSTFRSIFAKAYIFDKVDVVSIGW